MRLWELSKTPSEVEDTELATELKSEHRLFTVKERQKRDQKLATVLQDDPLEVFPTQEELEQQENDTTS